MTQKRITVSINAQEPWAISDAMALKRLGIQSCTKQIGKAFHVLVFERDFLRATQALNQEQEEE